MERTNSTASMRRRRQSSKKILRYSAQALSQFILLATSVFIALATVGLAVQAYRAVERGNTPSWLTFSKSSSTTATAPKEQSLYSLAMSTTVTAVSLWGRLVLSVLIPATDHSLVFAKEGWVALEPSVRQTSLWFVYDTSPAFKLGVASFFAFAFAIWLLERELKRRQIGERVVHQYRRVHARVQQANAWVTSRYAAVRDEVASKSRTAALLLPHVLYTAGCVVVYFGVGRDHVAPLSRGFAAWFVTIGIPVAFSTQKLVRYDLVCRERLKRQQPDRENVSSDEEDDGEDKEEEKQETLAAPVPVTPARTPRTPAASASASARGTEMVESAILSVRKRFLSDASLTSPMHDTHGVLNADTVHDFDPVLAWLRYFAVLSVCLLWEQAPVTGHMLGLIPVWPEIRLAFALWLQLPVTRGCDWAFLVIVPFLDRYVKRLPLVTDRATGLLQQTEQQRGLVITLLSTLGLVSPKTGKKLLKATEANGNLILVSVPFLLSPTFVTKIGVLVVGLAFPAQASTTCILEIEHFKQQIAARKKNDDNGEVGEEEYIHTNSNSGEASVFWLEYWIVYVLFSLVHGVAAAVLGWWFPLWDQMHLVVLLWMQITYFSGAHHVFNTAVVIARVYRKRRRAVNRATARQRQRDRLDSVATPREKIDGLMVSVLPKSMLPPRLSVHLEGEEAANFRLFLEEEAAAEESSSSSSEEEEEEEEEEGERRGVDDRRTSVASAATVVTSKPDEQTRRTSSRRPSVASTKS